MDNCKYVAFEHFEYGVEHIVIFSHYLAHRDVANMIERLGNRPLSAGFVQMTKDGPSCYGRSESMNLDSRPEIDTNLARRLLP